MIKYSAIRWQEASDFYWKMQERRPENRGKPNSFNVEFSRVIVSQAILNMKRERGLITEHDFARQSSRNEDESKRLLVGIARELVDFDDPDVARVSRMVVECGQDDSLIPFDLEKEFLEISKLNRSAVILN